jgi:hypothetical protein
MRMSGEANAPANLNSFPFPFHFPFGPPCCRHCYSMSVNAGV